MECKLKPNVCSVALHVLVEIIQNLNLQRQDLLLHNENDVSFREGSYTSLAS